MERRSVASQSSSISARTAETSRSRASRLQRNRSDPSYPLTVRRSTQQIHLWRAYTVEAGRDLFGAWVVEVSYGRIGRPGRILHHSFIEMCLQLRPTLAGDETGTSRIG